MKTNLLLSKPLISILMAAGLIGLPACTTSAKAGARDAASATPLTTQTHTAGEAGFNVNSHLIAGPHDAVLVDAQFTRSEAREAARMIRDSGKNLTAIFITHGHPDHYLGLEVLKREFPAARILARPEIIADIRAGAPGKIAYWKPIYKDDLADHFVEPQAFTDPELTIDGEKIEIIDLTNGESEHSSALYIPSTGTLLTGDAAYNSVHLWLAEDRPQGWLNQLAELRSVGPIAKVLPGHGLPGGVEILAEDERYIRNYLGATAKPATKEQALAKLMALYPAYALPVIAEISVGARVK